MPIAIVPPQGVTYAGSTLPHQVTLPWSLPPEGPKSVPLQALWSTDGGPNKSINVNLRSTQVATITQIVGLYVDNIRNEAAVTFYFPDTQFVLEVPPLSFGWYPVITTGISFVMYSPNAVDQDQTLIQVLNYWVDPIAVSNFAFSDNAAGTVTIGVPLTIASQTLVAQTLIPAGTEGIITGFNIDATDLSLTNRVGGPGTAIAGVALTDNSGATVYFGTGLFGAGYFPFLKLANMTGLSIAFGNGLTLSVKATGAYMIGFIVATIYWRQPT
jgi:hypothetical protein